MTRRKTPKQPPFKSRSDSPQKTQSVIKRWGFLLIAVCLSAIVGAGIYFLLPIADTPPLQPNNAVAVSEPKPQPAQEAMKPPTVVPAPTVASLCWRGELQRLSSNGVSSVARFSS